MTQDVKKLEKKKKLTPKQERFVEEYIKNGGNGVQAALEVYDTSDYKTASAIASENLDKPVISAAVKSIQVQLRDDVASCLREARALQAVVASAMYDLEHGDERTRNEARKILVEMGKSFSDKESESKDTLPIKNLPKR